MLLTLIFIGACAVEYVPKRAVWAHMSTVDEVRLEKDIPFARMGDALFLAFIHIESDGDPAAHRPRSQYYGLLQMGTAASTDVGVVNKDNLVPLTAVSSFVDYMHLYKKYHGWSPSRMAVCWKGGPGTCKKLGELTRKGVSLDAAILQLERANPKLGRLAEYVRRFRVAHSNYTNWLDEGNSPYQTESLIGKVAMWFKRGAQS